MFRIHKRLSRILEPRIERDISGDGGCPCRETRRTLELAGLSPGDRERLLNNVLGKMTVVGHSHRNEPQRVARSLGLVAKLLWRQLVPEPKPAQPCHFLVGNAQSLAAFVIPILYVAKSPGYCTYFGRRGQMWSCFLPEIRRPPPVRLPLQSAELAVLAA